MNRRFLIFAVGVTLLSACMVPPTATMPAPVETQIPAQPVASPTEEIGSPTEAAPQGKLPAAPFESRTYINDTVGFALDYPANWTANEMVVGDRGSQVQFLSSPDLADAAVVPAGETRLTATIYQWDPKNDLAAFVEHQKTAWEASGITIVDEEALTLELGLAATSFTLQGSDSDVSSLVTAIGDHYLVLSGEGDLNLAREIMQRLRPISP